ncbi:MAG: hypothetical protein AAF431_12715 [Pseudomonadota bacterium]
MRHLITEQDKAFRRAFESGQFPLESFDHRAHLRLAYIYCCTVTTEEAHQQMRRALHSFLKYNNIDSSKYHETITRAWIMAIRHFIERTKLSTSADDFIDQHPQLMNPDIMLSHYSQELLFSDAARETFVAPDKERIPRYTGVVG